MNPTFPLQDDSNGVLTVTNLIDTTGAPFAGPLPAVINASSLNGAQLSITPVAGQPAQFLVKSLAPVTDPITASISLTGTDAGTGAALATQVDFTITHDVVPPPPPVPAGFAVTFGNIQKN